VPQMLISLTSDFLHILNIESMTTMYRAFLIKFLINQLVKKLPDFIKSVHKSQTVDLFVMHSIHYLTNHSSSHYPPTYAYIALHIFTLIFVLCVSSKHGSFVSHPLHPSLFIPFTATQSTHVPILQCHQYYSFPWKLKHTACTNFLLTQNVQLRLPH